MKTNQLYKLRTQVSQLIFNKSSFSHHHLTSSSCHLLQHHLHFSSNRTDYFHHFHHACQQTAYVGRSGKTYSPLTVKLITGLGKLLGYNLRTSNAITLTSDFYDRCANQFETEKDFWTKGMNFFLYQLP